MGMFSSIKMPKIPRSKIHEAALLDLFWIFETKI